MLKAKGLRRILITGEPITGVPFGGPKPPLGKGGPIRFGQREAGARALEERSAPQEGPSFPEWIGSESKGILCRLEIFK
jgi:hypothetical protein